METYIWIITAVILTASTAYFCIKLATIKQAVGNKKAKDEIDDKVQTIMEDTYNFKEGCSHGQFRAKALASSMANTYFVAEDIKTAVIKTSIETAAGKSSYAKDSTIGNNIRNLTISGVRGAIKIANGESLQSTNEEQQRAKQSMFGIKNKVQDMRSISQSNFRTKL
jgi:hypothetical protein